MIGEMTRMAFESWFVTDEAWERYGELRVLNNEDYDNPNTMKTRLMVAKKVSDAIGGAQDARAVLFRGDGADDTSLPQFETRFAHGRIESRFGELSFELSQIDALPYSEDKLAFEDFVRLLRDYARESFDGDFQSVMLYLRSRSFSVRKPTKNGKLYAVRVTGDHSDHPRSELLPWAFPTASRAKSVMGRLAESVVPHNWEKYRILVDRDRCVVDKLPRRQENECAYHPDEDEHLALSVESVEVPKDFAAVPNADGDWFVGSWDLMRTKAWDTRHLNGTEWLQRLDPCSYGGQNVDAKGRSRMAHEAAAKCDWWKIRELSNLEVDQWVLVLRHRPDWADECPCWDELREFDWCRLLGRQPQFIDRLPAYVEFTPMQWSFLLRRQPQFADRCNCWNEMYPEDWERLLIDQPRFVERIDLEHASGELWTKVIKLFPEYAAHCPWGKLDESSWVELLSAMPEYAKHCDWSKIGDGSWIDLLRRHPDLEAYCDWDKIAGWAMVWIIQENRTFDVHADWSKLSRSDWVSLLKTFPDYIDKCDLDKLEAGDWYQILLEHPNLAGYFTKWDKLSEDQRLRLLQTSAEFCRCVDFRELSLAKRIEYLLLRPEFADKMIWQDIDDIGTWYRILSVRPNFACHFTEWDQLTRVQKQHLLQKSSEFCPFVDFKSLPLATRIDCLLLRPEFADKMVWQDVVDACDWYRLMAVMPDCRKYAPPDAVIPEAKGFVWLSKSGPVTVIPRPGAKWNEECPPCENVIRIRLDNACWKAMGGGHRNHYDDHSYPKHIVVEIANRTLSDLSTSNTFAIDLEGVYVGQESAAGAGCFAEILEYWFSEHETGIKIVYLECGSLYKFQP